MSAAAQHIKKALPILAVATFATSCAKPDMIVTFKPPKDDGFTYYTVETYHGQGAISNDFTRIYAHFPVADKTTTELVMDGPYLEGSQITWVDWQNVNICIPPGARIHTFRNETLMTVGSVSEPKHYHLKQHC